MPPQDQDRHRTEPDVADVTGPLTDAVERAAGRFGTDEDDTDEDGVERDLMKLVLTIVELLRQLMEKQALRRVEHGDLTEQQEERVGLTLMILDERMGELRDRYGLAPEDLNLDLGPLGSLLPR